MYKFIFMYRKEIYNNMENKKLTTDKYRMNKKQLLMASTMILTLLLSIDTYKVEGATTSENLDSSETTQETLNHSEKIESDLEINAVNLIAEADQLYVKFQEAFYVSELWSIAQEFKTDYPGDSRVESVMLDAAQANFNEGIRVHNSGDVNRALIYYNRILNEELASSLHKEVQINVDKINTQSADILYEEFQNSRYVSARWSIAQEFRIAYPNDSRINQVMTTAAEGYLREGQYRHNRGEYDRALIYYNHILGDDSVADYHMEVQKLVDEIMFAQNDPVADELYAEFKNASYVSERWRVAQTFKEEHPGDPRLNKVMLDAANGYRREGIFRHNRGEYDRALIYYNHILNESLVSELHSEVQALVDEIESIQNNPEADAMYQKFKDAYYVSDLWKIAQEFKENYPMDPRIESVMLEAAEANFNEGIRLHNHGDLERALIYYNRILNEAAVSSMHKDVQTYVDNINKPSANKLYKKFQDAYYVSARWNAAQEYKRFYPNDSRVKTVMTTAAKENLHEGLRASKSGDKSRAEIYYNRVSNEPFVDGSTRHLSKIFLNQLSENRKPIVYIDPGHGGHLPGAVYRGVTEKKLNLEVSNYLISELESMGYLVLTSRTSDTHIGLTERAMEANGGNADIFISVHHNAGGGRARGIETYVQHRAGYTTNQNNFDTKDPRISESVRLANSVQSNLIRDTGFQNRGVKGNNFNVIRNTYIPAILVELGYMDNPTELSIMQTPAHQRKSAKAIAKGVNTYFNGL